LPTDEPELVAIGRVGRPHGVDGAFVVEGASEDPRRFEVGARLYVAGKPAEVVLRRRVGGGRLAIRLDVAVERGSDLAVLRGDLPTPDPDSFYVSDLIGLQVLLVSGEKVGVVRDVLPGPANDNLELDSGALVPLVEDAVAEIDVPHGRVVLNPGFTD
jgi:16S rRNA processing protein RimM